MDRTTLLWTIVVFFGATLVFGLLRNATVDSALGVRIGVQVAALVLVVGAITFFVKRRQ